MTTAVLLLGHMWNRDRPAAPVSEPPVRVTAPDTPAPAPAPPSRAAPAETTARRPAASPGPAPAIYRCRDGARVVYADHPCGTGSEAVELPPQSAGLKPDRSYAEQLARVRSERAQHAAAQPARQTDRSLARDEQTRCAAIDRNIGQIDAATRQALTVPMAEYYREQRRTLMDERFSIGCKG